MGTFAGFLYHQVAVKPKPLPATVKLDGKTALVTGANGGLGLEASRELASHGLARLIITTRNQANGDAAKQAIQAQNPDVNVEVWQLDQEDWASIDDFGKRTASLDRLDIAILNAGVKNLDYVQSRTGHEQHVQVNHLGTALVSVHVLEALDRTAKAIGTLTRLTIVASENHFWCKAQELKAANILQEFDTARACFKGAERANTERYNTSKLLNVLWMRELSTRIARLGMNVIVNAVNPGFCKSALHRSHSMGAGLVNLIGYSAQQGGHCLTNAAILHENDQGAYLSEQQVKKPSAFVLSSEGTETQAKLWRETVTLLTNEAQQVELLKVLDEA